MSEADKLFLELGYWKYVDNDETIIYKKKGEMNRTSIGFDLRNFKKTFDGFDSFFIPHDVEHWTPQSFKSEWEKYNASQGHWETNGHDFTMKELKAINKKVSELGWSDE